MPFFVDETREAEPVDVGVIEQPVLAATNVTHEDMLLIVITNNHVEDFNGSVSCSPNGVDQWVPELNDEFAAIPAGMSRRMLVPADRLFARVNGAFPTTPGTVSLTTTMLRVATRRG